MGREKRQNDPAEAGGKPIGFEMKSEIVRGGEEVKVYETGKEDSALHTNTISSLPLIQTHHRSLTHVAIARSDDTEHNRRTVFPVSFPSTPGFIGMQASPNQAKSLSRQPDSANHARPRARL